MTKESQKTSTDKLLLTTIHVCCIPSYIKATATKHFKLILQMLITNLMHQELLEKYFSNCHKIDVVFL